MPQCIECLNKLEEEGLIQLPPLSNIGRKNNNKSTGEWNETIILDTAEVTECDMRNIKLEIVRPGEELRRWQEYIKRFHRQGYKKTFGSRLQYFVKSGERELGCLQFSASSWALAEREEWIGWTLDDRKERLNLVLNNSRCLIFPWVHIKNLASKILSLAAKQIQSDWLKEYCYAPVLLETFVEKDQFKGTSYKAANWIYIGETKGRGRMDTKHENAKSVKAIYVYPLQKDFRAVLKGEKRCKAVNPDEF